MPVPTTIMLYIAFLQLKSSCARNKIIKLCCSNANKYHLPRRDFLTATAAPCFTLRSLFCHSEWISLYSSSCSLRYPFVPGVCSFLEVFEVAGFLSSHALGRHGRLAEVDELEVVSYARRDRQLRAALDDKKREVKGRELTKKEDDDIKREIIAVEVAGREQPTVKISGQSEPVKLASLNRLYRLIRNLLWIDHHPVYKKALEEWEGEVNFFQCRVSRKLSRSGDLKTEIYNVIGFYSVFQGVLLTASSQSSYLHCQNVGFPIVLSAFASVGTLLHICQKFKVIRHYQKNINEEQTSLKEAKSRVLALRDKGPAFRFYDFLEDKEATGSNLNPVFRFCGLGIESWFIVPLAICLFSVVFIVAHPFLLCRPGHA